MEAIELERERREFEKIVRVQKETFCREQKELEKKQRQVLIHRSEILKQVIHFSTCYFFFWLHYKITLYYITVTFIRSTRKRENVSRQDKRCLMKVWQFAQKPLYVRKSCVMQWKGNVRRWKEIKCLKYTSMKWNEWSVIYNKVAYQHFLFIIHNISCINERHLHLWRSQENKGSLNTISKYYFHNITTFGSRSTISSICAADWPVLQQISSRLYVPVKYL